MPVFIPTSGNFISVEGNMNIIHPPQAMPEQNISSPEFVMEGPQ
jgi:hypothetical protein